MGRLKMTARVSLTICLCATTALAQHGKKPPEGLPAVANAVVGTLRAEPQKGRDAVRAGIEGCFPAGITPGFPSIAVKDAAVALHVAYLELVTGQMQPMARAQRFAELMELEEANLSPVDRKEIQAWKQAGLYDGLMLLCVASTARGLLAR